MCLVGMPESALNNLAPRFDEGVIASLPAFLRQNWAVALYHDRFGEFLAALRAELDGDDAFVSAMDKLRRMPEYDAGKLAPVDFMNLLPELKRNLVRTRLLDYVAGNQNHLDMYLVPASSIMKGLVSSCSCTPTMSRSGADLLRLRTRTVSWTLFFERLSSPSVRAMIHRGSPSSIVACRSSISADATSES